MGEMCYCRQMEWWVWVFTKPSDFYTEVVKTGIEDGSHGDIDYRLKEKLPKTGL